MGDEIQQGLYLYPVEELDKIIEQINTGIMPMMNDQLQKEVNLRFKEISGQLFDDDDEIDEDVIEQKKAVQRAIEKKKREASKKDVLIIKLNDTQKNQLHEDMSSSYVRKDPNLVYNLKDEDLYSSEEKKIIDMKLARLKNCYYNQTDYVNAIKIIQDAIKYSLKNDYPWMSEEEALRAFNNGDIKFTWGNLPKLYVNYSTQITDKEILKGVVTGQVTLKDRNSEEVVSKKKDKVKSNPVEMPYTITTNAMYEDMAKLHAKGYDTPMSLAFKSKSTIYNRFSLPYNSFMGINSDNNDKPVVDFDWEHEGAGEEYFNLVHGIKPSVNDIIRYVNDQNGKSLNNVLLQNAYKFMKSLKYQDGHSGGLYGDNGYARNDNGSSYVVNPHAVEVENNILKAIRMNNPTR